MISGNAYAPLAGVLGRKCELLRDLKRVRVRYSKESFVIYEVNWLSVLLYQSSALPQVGVHPDARRRLFDNRFPFGSQCFLVGIGAPSSPATES